MSIMGLLLIVIVFGLLALAIRYVPIEQPFKGIAYALLIVGLVLVILQNTRALDGVKL